jgi:stearoyl-CoA desaturase (delta-9 desaturase)
VTTRTAVRPELRLAVLIVAAVMLGFHLGSLAVFWTGISLATLAVAIPLSLLRALGITAGYHRLLAHRSFDTSRPMRFLLSLAGVLALQGGPLWWVAHHRAHHRDTDREGDVHSPVTRGLWHAHVGWMLEPEAFREQGSYARDVARAPELRWLQRNYVLLLLAQAAVLYALGAGLDAAWPALDTSGAQMLVVGLFLTTVITWHVTFAVNSVCHRWGSRLWDTDDASRNHFLVGLLALGEGWHNNHHRFPNSARHGLLWWQPDATWWVLRGLERLGLVWNLKTPPSARLEARTAGG